MPVAFAEQGLGDGLYAERPAAMRFRIDFRQLRAHRRSFVARPVERDLRVDADAYEGFAFARGGCRILAKPDPEVDSREEAEPHLRGQDTNNRIGLTIQQDLVAHDVRVFAVVAAPKAVIQNRDGWGPREILAVGETSAQHGTGAPKLEIVVGDAQCSNVGRLTVAGQHEIFPHRYGGVDEDVRVFFQERKVRERCRRFGVVRLHAHRLDEAERVRVGDGSSLKRMLFTRLKIVVFTLMPSARVPAARSVKVRFLMSERAP